MQISSFTLIAMCGLALPKNFHSRLLTCTRVAIELSVLFHGHFGRGIAQNAWFQSKPRRLQNR